MLATTAGRRDPSRRRMVCLLGAGLVDSFCLSLAWTVLVLEVTRQHGLVAAGLCSTAMLLGVALSAPTATWMAQQLDGRRLLRTAGGVEAVLRLSVIALLAGDASIWLIAASVTAMNVMAWTGYAGMRAEVAAVSDGASGITWYGTVVAAVEAVGVAAGALLLGAGTQASSTVVVGVGLLYVGALVPTLIVAGGSKVPRSARESVRSRRPLSAWPPQSRHPSRATLLGALLMMAASAPALLAVALAAEMHGRAAVGAAAAAFTIGSLLAPTLAGAIERRSRNDPARWWLLATGMVLGWTLAPHSVVWLCVAQALSGLCMTTLEGLLDTRASQDRPDAVTAALAHATAARALGSSAGTAVLPVIVAGSGLSATAVALTAVLATIAVIVNGTSLVRRRRYADGAMGPALAAAPPDSADRPSAAASPTAA